MRPIEFIILCLVIIFIFVFLGLGLALGVPEPEVPKWTPDVDFYAGLATPVRVDRNPKWEEAKTCLALNAYYEARGESYEGQVAVGQVALRRAGLDYRYVCGEIYKPGQFSWTGERSRYGALPKGDTWQWALAAANDALDWGATGRGVDYSRGATYFHARRVSPYWTRGLEQVAIVGDHLFYR